MSTPLEKQFIGEIVDHIGPRIMTVADLDTGGFYRVHGVSEADWPVGSIGRCTYTSQYGFVFRIEAIDEATHDEYAKKRLIPPHMLCTPP